MWSILCIVILFADSIRMYITYSHKIAKMQASKELTDADLYHLRNVIMRQQQTLEKQRDLVNDQSKLISELQTNVMSVKGLALWEQHIAERVREQTLEDLFRARAEAAWPITSKTKATA